MAKSTERFQTGEFDFDSSLDYEIPDYSALPAKKDRNPVLSATRVGVKSAVKSFFSGNTVKKIIREALPKSYGKAMDLGFDTARNVRSLYDTAQKEIGPLTDDLKRTTSRLESDINGRFSKKNADRIMAWSRTARQGSRELSPAARRESEIAALMGEMGRNTQLESDEREERRESLRQGVEQIRHRDQIGVMETISTGIQRLVAYQDRVGIQFARKTLELTYRKYYLEQDSYALQRKFVEQTFAQLEDIKKNTGLPDYVKLNTTERLGEFMRNKFISGVSDGLFQRRQAFMGNMFGRLQKNTKQVASNFASGVRTGLSFVEAGADMARDQREANAMMAEMGGPVAGKYDLVGEFGGSIAGSAAGGQLGKLLKRLVGNNSKVIKGGNKLEYAIDNLPQIMTQYARSGKHESGALGEVVRFFKNSMLDSTDNTLQSMGYKDLGKPGAFNNQSVKTLNEVIPRYLSGIYQELQIMRTGDNSIQPALFDFKTNKLTSKAGMKQSIFGAMVSDRDVRFGKEDTDYLFKMIDPDNKLSDKDRADLAKIITKDNFNNGLASKDRLSKATTFGGGEAGARYAKMFSDYLASDPDASKINKVSKAYSNMGRWSTDARSEVQELLNRGYGDILEEMGVIKKSANGTFSVDQDRLIDFYHGDTLSPDAESVGDIGTPKRFRKSRVRSSRAERSKTVKAPIPQQRVSAQALHSEFRMSPEEKQELYDKLTTLSQETTSVEIRDVLNIISEKLDRAMPVFVIEDTGEGDGGATGKRWYQRSVGDTLGRAGSFLTRNFNRARKFGSNLVSGALRDARKATSFIWDKGSAFASKATNFLLGKHELADIYIKGEVEPRLTAMGLKAGKYRDMQTNKIIKSLKDIKGTIVDEDGNVVLKIDEIKSAFAKVIGEHKPRLLTALTGIKNFATGLVDQALTTAGGVWGMGYGILKNQGMRAYTFLTDRAVDVYVKGKEYPALLAITMKSGGYYSKNSKKPILKPSDIDGPVVDQEGNIVLTEDDIKMGLLDAKGKPLKTGMAKIFQSITNFGSSIMGFGKRTAESIIKGGQAALKAMGDILGGLFGGGFGGKKTRSILHQIYDLLDERIPYRKRIRKGSYEDQVANSKMSTIDPTKPQSKDPTSKGGLLGALSTLFGRNRQRDDNEPEESKDGDTYVLGGDGGDGRRRGRRGGRQPIPKGFWNKLKWGAKGLGRGAMSLGRGALGLLGMGGLTGMLTGAGSLVAGAASAIGSGIAAAASVVGAPVLLGGAAIAAVGAGAYYGYKFLTRKKLELLSKYRFAQYGFLPSEKDHIQAVLELEDLAQEALKFNGDVAELDESKFKMNKALDMFGVKEQDKHGMDSWVKWFQGRFKPVFLTHATILRKLNPKATVGSADSDIKDVDKLDYFRQSKFPDGPYNFPTNPFAGKTLLNASKHEVDTIGADIEKELQKLAGDDKPKTTLPDAGIAPTPDAATAATSAALAATADGNTSNSDGTSLLSKVGGALSRFNPISMVSKALGTVVGSGLSLAGIDIGMFSPNKEVLTELDSVRFKTYGLKEMEASKVFALRALEAEMEKHISFTPEKLAKFNSEAESILRVVSGFFGINGVNSTDSLGWYNWFHERFLPVYLNYASVIMAYTGKDKPSKGLAFLTKPQMVEIGMAIYTTTGTKEGVKTSVWEILQSPWPNYIPGMDRSIVEPNMNSLRNATKNVVLPESTALSDKDQDKQKTEEELKANNPNFLKTLAGKLTGALGGIGRFASGAFSSLFGTANANTGGVSPEQERQFMTSWGTGDLNVDGSRRAPVDLQSGATVQHPGAGTGGDINDIPMPTGNKSWAGVKDLIMAAARMVGIDPMLMASIAAIESGFDYSVKAKTSSATGLFQFIRSTWNSMISKYGAKYGINPNTPPTDPRANALMGGEFLKENTNVLKRVLTRPVTDTDVYMAHFLGPGGATKFFQSDMNDIGALRMPEAAAANQSIFRHRDGKPRTFGEIYNLMNEKVRSRAKQYGIDVATVDAPVPSTEPAAEGIPDDGPKASVINDVMSGPVSPTAAGATMPVSTRPASTNSLGAAFDQSPSASSNPDPLGAAYAVQQPNNVEFTSNAAARQSQAVSDAQHALKAQQHQETTSIMSKQYEVQVDMRNLLQRLVDLMPNGSQNQNRPPASQADLAPALTPSVPMRRNF